MEVVVKSSWARKELAFPQRCCCCMAKTFDTLKVLGSVEDSIESTFPYGLRVPFCHECKGHRKAAQRWTLIPLALVGVLIVAVLADIGVAGDEAVIYQMIVPWVVVSGALFAIVFSAVAYYYSIWPARNPSHAHVGVPGPANVQISSVEVHFFFDNDDYGRLFAEANREVDGLRVIPPRQ